MSQQRRVREISSQYKTMNRIGTVNASKVMVAVNKRTKSLSQWNSAVPPQLQLGSFIDLSIEPRYPSPIKVNESVLVSPMSNTCQSELKHSVPESKI